MSSQTRKKRVPVEVYAGERFLWDLLEEAERTGVYKFQAFGSTFVLPREKRFPSIERMQDYAEELRSKRWVRERWPERALTKVIVAPRNHDHGSAMYRQGRITVPPLYRWMREILLLHELAHHYSGSNGHGQKFREVYYALVEGMMGPEASFLLKMSIETEMGGN